LRYVQLTELYQLSRFCQGARIEAPPWFQSDLFRLRLGPEFGRSQDRDNFKVQPDHASGT
jgi:hypothetical protein